MHHLLKFYHLDFITTSFLVIQFIPTTILNKSQYLSQISFVCYFYKLNRILFHQIKVFSTKEYGKLLLQKKYHIVAQHGYFM